jgi:UDP-3-O-[3-hydroxymyristoyl] glucosamine N-acyltransferase
MVDAVNNPTDIPFTYRTIFCEGVDQVLFIKKQTACYASEIASFLNLTLIGDECKVRGVSGINHPESHTLMFFTSKGNTKFNLDNKHKFELENLSNFENIVLITNEETSRIAPCSCIISANPKLDFVKAMHQFFVELQREGINPHALIDPGAKIGKNVSIGANSIIGPDVKIGDNVIICANVVITGEVDIGDNTVIKSNSTIGSEGFNFVYNNDKPLHFPHIGKIIIGNNVMIGSNTCIERGALDDVIIEDDVKIDDLVQIGHNVCIGEKSLICAGSIIAGSVKMGKGCYVAPIVCVDSGIVVEDDALLGTGSIVRKDVPKGAVMVGNPARKLR